GIEISSGAARNLVAGNLIGTNASGTAALGNDTGVLVGGPNNTVGGTLTGARNIISGNKGIGVIVYSANFVVGNFIGTNAAGTAAIGNATGVGVGGTNNIVGGTTAGARNVISGNSFCGIWLSGGGMDAENNLVQGNYIGTDSTGTAPLGNYRGVYLS